MGSEEKLQLLGLAHLADDPTALRAEIKRRRDQYDKELQEAKEARAKDPEVQRRAMLHKIMKEARIKAKEAEEARQLKLQNHE